MINIEKNEGFVRVTTDEPIWILLLHSETEYYDYVFLPIGFCDCGCDEVVWTYSEAAILEHIRINNLTKYIPEQNENNI